MKAAAFTLQQPATLADLRQLWPGLAGARLIAGGQSLGAMLNLRVVQPAALIGLDRLPLLRGVSADPDSVTIGAGITHAEIEDGQVPDIGSCILPAIAAGIAYRAVRNRGTLGGSLCHADPAADWPTTLMALDAELLTVTLAAPDRPGRRIRLQDFILGAFRTALAADELLQAVRVPRLAAGARWIYRKACRKPGEFAHAMIALLDEPARRRRRLVVGAVGGAPLLFENGAATWTTVAAALADGASGLDAVKRHQQLVLLGRVLAELDQGGGDMTRLGLTVNGRAVVAEVEPRTHLADFLREQLSLTGTHLGCEHGVCGACTLLLDGRPVRSCLTFAAGCQGQSVETIEGVQQDPLIAALRQAFSAEHALQCGYCTPGMLMTAQDIIRRLPDADDDRIRLELSGNLCRCTGYNGIVRAIRRVLEQRLALAAAPVPGLAVGDFAAVAVDDVVAVAATAAPSQREAPMAAAAAPDGPQLRQSVILDLPLAEVWRAVQDPLLIASCLPGATVTLLPDGRLDGSLQVTLGPISTRFRGQATVLYDPQRRGGRISGDGRDAGSGTLISVAADFVLLALAPERTELRLEIAYSLQGGLASLARPAVLRLLVADTAAVVGRSLAARFSGAAVPEAPTLASGRLLLRLLRRALAGWLNRLAGRAGHD